VVVFLFALLDLLLRSQRSWAQDSKADARDQVQLDTANFHPRSEKLLLSERLAAHRHTASHAARLHEKEINKQRK
jgi:hypothetical protein